MADATAITRLGPQHAGKRLTLAEFASLETEPGYLYELDKGMLVVAELPGVLHALMVQIVRDALAFYRQSHPRDVFLVGGGGETGLQMPELQSQRHPDVSVYLRPPPTSDAQPWEIWVPDIVVEIVSEGSVHRDYEDKPDEYLKAGVKVYWIVDPLTRTATVLTRRTDSWRRVQVDASGALSAASLPGFSLPLAEVFRIVD